jgi:hypothetical protein
MGRKEQYSNTNNTNTLVKWILIFSGSICLGLGIIGIVLPVLPTTPFLLIAAALYARSSSRFYNWIIGNRWFGKYIKAYREGKGVSLKIKAGAITILWITVLVSVIFALQILWLRLLLIVIASLATVYISTLPVDSTKK